MYRGIEKWRAAAYGGGGAYSNKSFKKTVIILYIYYDERVFSITFSRSIAIHVYNTNVYISWIRSLDWAFSKKVEFKAETFVCAYRNAGSPTRQSSGRATLSRLIYLHTAFATTTSPRKITYFSIKNSSEVCPYIAINIYTYTLSDKEFNTTLRVYSMAITRPRDRSIFFQ